VAVEAMMWKKNSSGYVFGKKDRTVRSGVFYSGEFEGMAVRIDLEGQWCFGIGSICRGTLIIWWCWF